MATLPPGQQRDELLAQLRATRDTLMSAEWLTRIRRAPPEQRTAAADAQFKVHIAILDFETAELDDIRDDLIANSAELSRATGGLKDALTSLNRVAAVLKAVSGFLDVVAKVVKLV